MIKGETSLLDSNQSLLVLAGSLALLTALILQSDNWSQLLVLLLLPVLFLIVWKSSLLALIVISLAVFFGDWLINLDILPAQFMWIQELLVLLLAIKALGSKILKKKKIEFVGGWLILAFAVISLASSCVNGSGWLNFLLFLRLPVRYYLLFLAVINMDLGDDEVKIFNTLLLGLVIIQVPVAVAKLLRYGQGETAIGTYDVSGGVLSTTLPLVVIGFALSYYLLHKKSFLYVFLILAFIGFSIIGGKRAFIFYLPFIIVVLGWYMRKDFRSLFRYSVVGAAIFVIALYSVLSLVPSLRPSWAGGQKVDLKYALAYAVDYNTETRGGVTYGRAVTSVNVFRNLRGRGALPFLLGIGPGSIMKSRFKDQDIGETLKQEFGVGYGVSGLTWFAMNAGYAGALTIFALLFLLMRKSVLCFRKEKDTYWRSFGLGMIVFSFTMILINLTYGVILNLDLVSMHFFCLSGFAVLRERRPA
jgi:hypothetical protein